MAHQIDLIEIERLDHGAEIGGQAAHAVAIVGRARFTVAAHVERDHAPCVREFAQLILVPCASQRPGRNDDQRPAFARFDIMQ